MFCYLLIVLWASIGNQLFDFSNCLSWEYKFHLLSIKLKGIKISIPINKFYIIPITGLSNKVMFRHISTSAILERGGTTATQKVMDPVLM